MAPAAIDMHYVLDMHCVLDMLLTGACPISNSICASHER